MRVANPLQLTFSQWANALTEENGLPIAPPISEEDWLQWAQDLRDTINIGSNLPDPNYYDKWQPWAVDALTALERF
jgi:hypothetical protein